MLFEIHEHQAAGENEVQDRPPTLLGGKHLVTVKQDQLVRFRSDQLDKASTKTVGTIDRAKLADHPAGKRMRILELFKRRADDRPAVSARNIVNVLPLPWREPMGIGSMGVGIGHGNDAPDKIAYSDVNN